MPGHIQTFSAPRKSSSKGMNCWVVNKSAIVIRSQRCFHASDEADKVEQLWENLIISPLTGQDLIILTPKSSASPFSADNSAPEG